MKDTMVKSYECPICHEEITAEKLVILPEDEHELHEELLGNIGDHMFSCHEAKRTPDAEQLKARIAELEKLAVVWHKYPDEKPTKARMYAIAYRKNGETIYGYSIWHTTTSSWHKNTNDLDIVAWWKFPKLSSELTKPAPPEEQ